MKFDIVSFDSIQNLLDMLDVDAGAAPAGGRCRKGCTGGGCGDCGDGCVE